MGVVEEQNARVEDYLNDKLQTTADLANLDSLLTSVKDQQVLLRRQLQEAEESVRRAHEASKGKASSTRKRIEQFNRQQHDIDRRLRIVTQSDASDEAAQRFEETVEKLQRLDVATAYVRLLREVDDLSAEARRHITTSPQAALKPYVRLQRISASLQNLQSDAEGAAPHLVDHVGKACDDLWKQMKGTLSGEFEALLRKIKWPTKTMSDDGTLRTQWWEGIKKLLEFQEPELLMRGEESNVSPTTADPVVLLPLEVMMRPLELRFRYHFDGDRPTNRLDKPEYFMSHVIDLITSYSDFFAEYLQPVLQDYFKGSKLAGNPSYVDSTSALITAILPMLRRKIFAVIPQIASQPQLLSHFIHEVINFDTTLRDEWGYDSGIGAERWKGLTWEILVKKDWFGRWLQVEKECECLAFHRILKSIERVLADVMSVCQVALSRYQNIIDAPDARDIDYDSVEPSVTKPTKAAIRVNDLLETITDRYRPLTSFSQKLRFLIDIQIAIFDKFHNRLHSGLEAYHAATSTVARAVQGVSRDDKASVQGVSGLQRLCRIYGSAEYLEKAMSDWSDDVFFLELWEELQERVRGNTGGNVAGPMSISDVAERTSSAVGTDEDSGALFDETAGAYQTLRLRTEEVIIDSLVGNARESLRPYSRINPWTTLTSRTSTGSTTAELDPLLHTLTSLLSFLSTALARAPLRHIARQVVLAIQTYLWDYILFRNAFSLSGAQQFALDVRAVADVVDGYVGPGQAAIGMRRLAEGLRLLTLGAAAQADAEGGGEAEADEATGDAARVPGLEEVERKVFESNEAAREMLAELGVQTLTESEARSVLERRVEVGN
ncbi:MAG: hypothetical protein M1833_005027 [Piccolia ochrophora]|nr:MAG: hypothetical protein M1833_005027 [Piccolia ochrophora]